MTRQPITPSVLRPHKPRRRVTTPMPVPACHSAPQTHTGRLRAICRAIETALAEPLTAEMRGAR